MQPNIPTTVYRIDLRLDEQQLQTMRSTLIPAEQARADRYLVQHARVQYIACRAALRRLLAESLECEPTDVQLASERWGKPYLDSSRDSNPDATTARAPHFNVSHSGELGLIALSTAPVGVDLEKLQPRIHARSLVSQVLSQRELRYWQNIHPTQQIEQILRLWVCKEALLKALGLGIAECLKQVSYQLPIEGWTAFSPVQIDPAIQLHLDETDNCRRNSWTLPQSWSVHPLAVSADYYAAVVTHHPRESSIELVDFVWE